MKLVCLPCEIQHREFDSKLILAARLASTKKCAVLIGYDKYFSSILNHIPNCFLLDKSMSTIMLKSRIEPCKNLDGVIFIHDEEGVNDLDETPEALDIRSDANAVHSIDKYLAWGSDDAKFFSDRKPGLSSKIVITGSHRYDLLSSIGSSIYKTDIESISHLFGDYILFNDNLAVDHFDKNYTPPTRLFKSNPSKLASANKEWEKITSDHSSRRHQVRDFLLGIASSGLNVVVRPHPVYDPLFWHESFRLIPNIQTIYKGPVEPWIHASTATITTGCTTGLQALLALKPSYELPVGCNSKAFSSTILPICENAKTLHPSTINSHQKRFISALHKLKNRWFTDSSSTLLFSNIILESLDSLKNHSGFDWLTQVNRLTPQPPKWRECRTPSVLQRFEVIKNTIGLSSNLKCSKVSNALYFVYTN